MNSGNWQHHSSAPLWVKLFSYISVAALLFFVLHTAILFIYAGEIDGGKFNVETWTQELYLNIWAVLPVFLFVTGKSLQQKPEGRTLLICAALFAALYLLNFGNTYEWLDIPHLQYPMTLLLLIILGVWIAAVAKRKKTISDALKFIWLFGFVYSFAVPRFVPSGHEAGNFMLASMFIFPFMMAVGFVHFFRKPKTIAHAT